MIKKETVGSFFLYFIYFCIMIFLLVNKLNLYVDEVLTYGLANYAYEGVGDIFIDGYKYEPSENAYLQYVSVDEENRFHYDNVWINQNNDVHPPLYYVLVHTICSFFPGMFSIWFAGIVNIIFALLAFMIVRKILNKFVDDKGIAFMLSIVYIFATGIWDAVVFLRMYAMAMSFVVMITYLVVDCMQEASIPLSKHGAILAISVCGALTHYYFIVYLFFLYSFYCIFLLVRRRYKEFGKIILNSLTAGIMTILIFPSVINHIFLDKGNRGEESFNNLTSGSLLEYFERLKTFFDFLNEKMFGGLVIYIGVGIFLITICHFFSKRIWEKLHIEMEKKELIWQWLALWIPQLLYFFLVSKIAVYVLDRYMIPIYPIMWLGIYVVFYKVVKNILNRRNAIVFIIVFSMVACICSLETYGGNYLYRNEKAFFDKTKQYVETDCLYVYDEKWKIYQSFLEVSNYNSVTFCSQDNIYQQLPENVDDKLIVCITNACDTDTIKMIVQKSYPNLDVCEELGKFGYATTWLFSN